MYNSFFVRQLFCLTFVSLVNIAIAIGQQEIVASRTLDLSSSYEEGLYHHVLTSVDPYEEYKFIGDFDRKQVVSLLHRRYPQLTYQLERTSRQTLSGEEISNLLVQILKEETAANVVDPEDSFWKIVATSDMTRQDEAIFQFLYGYELFKQKDFERANAVFNEIIKHRKGEYEYSFYYSGLIALMQQEYTEAQEKLKMVGKNKKLRQHTPYYLAAAHYGKGDFAAVTKFYEPRITDNTLHNVEGITKIVAFSLFQTEQFDRAISALNRLSKIRNLTAEESYLLGIAYQKTGNQKASSQYLSAVAAVQDGISNKAAYEHALNLAQEGKDGEALSKFEELLLTGEFYKDDIHWNLAILNGRLQNYDKLGFHAAYLLDGPKKDQSIALLSDVLDNLENEALYLKLITQLNTRTEDKDFLKKSVYNKALSHLKNDRINSASVYFDLLTTIDPLVEERGIVAAWRGIMAYQEGNLNKAARLLTNYSNSKSFEGKPNQLDFDVAYFLAYTHFKRKDHSSALGYFSKALELIQKDQVDIPDSQIKGEDIFLRLGDSYFLLDEYDSAKRAYDRIINNGGMQKDYALWQNAIIAELEGRSYDQILILDEIISDHKKSKYFNRAMLNTANALFTINRYDKAASFYNAVRKSNAELDMKEESTVQLGLISVNAGEYQRAENYFKELIKQSSNPEIIQRSHIALKEIYSDHTYDTDAYLNLIANTQEDNNDPKVVAQALYDLAQSNYEKGNFEKSIEQFSRYISEHPDQEHKALLYYKIGLAHTSLNQHEKALQSFITCAKLPLHDRTIEAFDKAEQLSYSQLKDYATYLSIINERKKAFPTQLLTSRQKYNLAYANIGIRDVDKAALLATQVLQEKDILLSEKKLLLNGISDDYFKNKKWSELELFYSNKYAANIVNKDPKLIYQRALVYFNSDKLEFALTGITDHYDTLLESPAWLAKGIILISDIYVLKDDRESASAALEALINSDSNIPKGLIANAKERLKALNPQN